VWQSLKDKIKGGGSKTSDKKKVDGFKVIMHQTHLLLRSSEPTVTIVKVPLVPDSSVARNFLFDPETIGCLLELLDSLFG